MKLSECWIVACGWLLLLFLLLLLFVFFFVFLFLFFFFKQKTAYEIGTGDWSSDVCSSDLASL